MKIISDTLRKLNPTHMPPSLWIPKETHVSGFDFGMRKICVTDIVTITRAHTHWALPSTGLCLAHHTCTCISHNLKEVHTRTLLFQLRTWRCLQWGNLSRVKLGKEVVRVGCWPGSVQATSSDISTSKITADQPSMHRLQWDLKIQASISLSF